MDMKKTRFRIGGFCFFGADIAALVVFAAFAVCLFISAPYGLTEVDETLHMVSQYRLFRGDRLFFDDWTLSPFSTLFIFPSVSIYYSIVGSFAGAALALRYMFVALKLAVFGILYCCLRSRGYWGLLASAVFTNAFPFGMKTLGYYFVCGCALMFTGYVLFIKKDAGRAMYRLAGFVFSCAVLAEPGMAAIWILYSALVLCRYFCRKKSLRFFENYDFVLSPAVWRSLFFGVLSAVAVLFLLCAAFFMRVPLSGLAEGFRNALNDPERSVGAGALLKNWLDVLGIYTRIYHIGLLSVFLFLLAASVAAHRFYKKAEPVLFSMLMILYAWLTLRTLTYPMEEIGFAIGETICHPLPLCLLALAAYGNTVQKDCRLFAFLLFGFAAMVCGDLISMTAFGAFSEVIAVPALLILRDYAGEAFSHEAEVAAKKKNSKVCRASLRNAGLLTAILAVLMVFMPLAEVAHGVYMLRLHETERLLVQDTAPLDETIDAGVLKGLRTTVQIAEAYEKSVRDAETISTMCDNRLYVADYSPTVYLDSDVMIGAHSPFYYAQEGWERVSLWWKMHPDKKPDVIYIPYIKFSYMDYPDASAEEKLSWLREHAEIEVTEGEIGVIVKVLEWKN